MKYVLSLSSIIVFVLAISACSGDPNFQRVDPHTPFWGASQLGIEDDSSEEVYLLKGAGDILGDGGYMGVELSRSERGGVGRLYRLWLTEVEAARPGDMSEASINGREVHVLRLPKDLVRLVVYKTEGGFDKQKLYVCSEVKRVNRCTVFFQRKGLYVRYSFDEALWPREDELYHVILGHVDKL